MSEPFDLDVLDDEEPFEVDQQTAHLFKHPHLGLEDVMDVWNSDPLFYPAGPLADARRGRRSSSHRSVGPIAFGQSGQVPTDRLL